LNAVQEETRVALEKVRRGMFGQQRSLKPLFELVEQLTGAECPECEKRREQTRLRVQKAREKAAVKLKSRKRRS